jgi:hypothetical protein
MILIPFTYIHVEWELGSSPSSNMFMHTFSQSNQGEWLGNLKFDFGGEFGKGLLILHKI